MSCVMAAGSAAAVAFVQALLVYAIARAASVLGRAVLLALKLLLWAGFFVVLALAGRSGLLAGGLTAGAVFPVGALLLRAYSAREKGDG